MIERFIENPIIYPGMEGFGGDESHNINGPSLIRAPPWVRPPLGKYYLYFAHHSGRYIRLAYADALGGPWTIHPRGSLDLSATPFVDHIASPDVHIEGTEVLMYFHGGDGPGREQNTYLATSTDGIAFRVVSGPLGPFYFRVFRHRGWYYAVAKLREEGGALLRSSDGRTPFEAGPRWVPRMRHAAVQLVNDRMLWLYFSRIGDSPEGILRSCVSLDGDWRQWSPASPYQCVAFPMSDYEGARYPLQPSRYGSAPGPVHQLRDPALFVEGTRSYLVYAVAGESGLAVAEIRDAS